MANVVVCGGGVIGLTSAMLLARDGHEVTVPKRDGAEASDSVDDAWARWERPEVPQLHQSHIVTPRSRQIIEAELPDVFGRLVDASGTWVNSIENLPGSITDRAPVPTMTGFASARGADRWPSTSMRVRRRMSRA